MSHLRLGGLLLAADIVTRSEVDFAAAIQAASVRSDKIGAILVDQGLLSRDSLARTLAEQAGWEFFGGQYLPDQEAAEKIGLAFIKEHWVFPLKVTEGYGFVFSDGDNTRATDRLLGCFGSAVRFFVGEEACIKDAIAALERRPGGDIAGGLTDIKHLLDEAAANGATDIHIEPADATVNVRLRIDGVLHFYRAYPRTELARIVNMAFNRAGLSAGDVLRFHDARFEEECAGRKLDIRLSHLPSANGSSLVLRILDKSRSAVPLAELGYSDLNQRQLVKAIRRPHGLVLFTGPTGCGKTTSLYSLLSGLKGLGIKVVTAEDPVEVRVPLVTQVPVDLRREQDFHHITRALLRHDPDVVLIGEIRDEKTAREALRAAVTGHRVLATLHTNDVMGAILRLRDLGIDHAYISHALTCIVAQRLVRKLCPECKEFAGPGEGFVHHEPGCPACLGGYRGRTVAAEVMYVDDAMRFLIEQGLIQEVAVKYQQDPGRLSMRADAERLVREGLVSKLEIERVFG
ncbi:MAG: type II/IV secretion system protein [Candidatus Omnitrophica bacterium]|nr:type II/IV secretion system protein [Candidatus Omnitrophota bacterium]